MRVDKALSFAAAVVCGLGFLDLAITDAESWKRIITLIMTGLNLFYALLQKNE
jgi:hypothetical protein